MIFLQILGVQRIFSLKGLPLALLIHLACLALLKIIAPFLVKPLKDIPEDLRFLEYPEGAVARAEQEADQVLVVDREVHMLCPENHPRWTSTLDQPPL